MAKVDQGLSSVSTTGGGRGADPYLRDLGVLAYLEATGRPPADIEAQRARCNDAIYQLESQGPVNLALSSQAPPPPGAGAVPPPPGAAAAAAAAPPPPASEQAVEPAAPPAAAPPPPGQVAPPPPPGSVAPPPPPAGR
jgi:hypothetical protein